MTLRLAEHGLFAEVGQEELEPALEAWAWLVGPDPRPLRLSLSGDLFLVDADGAVLWLETGAGTLARIAASRQEFESALEDVERRNEWLLESVVRERIASGGKLARGECFGYRTLPVVGGEYDGENRVRIRGVEHLQFTGHFHRQIEGLPDGAEIRIEIVD